MHSILFFIFGKDFLTELSEHGKEPFVNSFEDEKKEQIDLIVNQMHSYKDFCEKTNGLMQEILCLLNFTSLDETIAYLSKNFKQTFQAENVHLWVREAVNTSSR